MQLVETTIIRPLARLVERVRSALHPPTAEDPNSRDDNSQDLFERMNTIRHSTFDIRAFPARRAGQQADGTKAPRRRKERKAHNHSFSNRLKRLASCKAFVHGITGSSLATASVMSSSHLRRGRPWARPFFQPSGVHNKAREAQVSFSEVTSFLAHFNLSRRCASVHSKI